MPGGETLTQIHLAFFVLVAVLVACLDIGSESAGLLGVEVRNQTQSVVDHVSIEGVGAPGGFGVCVPGGVAVIYYSPSEMGSRFMLTWFEVDGERRVVEFDVPEGFGGGAKLVVCIREGGETDVYVTR